VKWQLAVGARPEKFSDELLAPRRSRPAYRKAPRAVLASGAGPWADELVPVFAWEWLKKEKKDEIAKGVSAIRRKSTWRINRYYIPGRIRNSMYAHLPPNGDAMMAGLEDIFVRVRHGGAVEGNLGFGSQGRCRRGR